MEEDLSDETSKSKKKKNLLIFLIFSTVIILIVAYCMFSFFSESLNDSARKFPMIHHQNSIDQKSITITGVFCDPDNPLRYSDIFFQAGPYDWSDKYYVQKNMTLTKYSKGNTSQAIITKGDVISGFNVNVTYYVTHFSKYMNDFQSIDIVDFSWS